MFFLFIFSIVLFLLSIDYISKNIDNQFSEFIKNTIIKINHNPWFLLLIGIICTMLVQSSSLIISLVILLVANKKITFHDSLFLMMGSNIGTCSTAFITAFRSIYFIFFIFFIYLLIWIFFKKKVKILIGIDMLLISICILDYAVSPLMHSTWFPKLFSNDHSTLFNLLLSSIITGITQSSSAIVATLQSFAFHNLINIKTATDMMMGANIGTCVTAFLVCFRGNELSKKCAVFNFIFNIVGVGAFLLFREIVPIYRLVNTFPIKLQIAYIHLLFNLLNVSIYLPFLLKKHSNLK